MSISSLINKTQAHFVNSKKGFGCDIDYKYFHDNKVETHLRALVSEEDFRKLSSDKQVIQDDISFLLVKLPQKPNKKDVVISKGVEYLVEDFRSSGNERYDLFCKGNSTFTGGTHRRTGKWQ